MYKDEYNEAHRAHAYRLLFDWLVFIGLIAWTLHKMGIL